MPIGRVWLFVERDEVISSARRSIAIAFALLLHISLFIWLASPPRPLEYAAPDTIDAQTLKVTFIKVPTQERARAPHIPHPSPSTQAPIARTETIGSVRRISRALSAPLDQPVVSASATLPAARPSPAPMAEPEAVPYGNSRFEKALTNAQMESTVRLPGDDGPMKVRGIHVETPPSISQDLHAAGHLLRCKDAIFKGRMTDQELARRGLTERQMMLEFTEVGCH